MADNRADNPLPYTYSEPEAESSEDEPEREQLKNSGTSQRPRVTYLQIIQMAINSTADKRMTLKDIYDWIPENFPYYRSRPKEGMKNSVRHNLSIHQLFVRVPGANVSSYWTLSEHNTNKPTRRSRRRPKNTHTKNAKLGGGQSMGMTGNCPPSHITAPNIIKPRRALPPLIPISACQSLMPRTDGGMVAPQQQVVVSSLSVIDPGQLQPTLDGSTSYPALPPLIPISACQSLMPRTDRGMVAPQQQVVVSSLSVIDPGQLQHTLDGSTSYPDQQAVNGQTALAHTSWSKNITQSLDVGLHTLQQSDTQVLGIFGCDQCDKQFDDLTEATTHIQTHSGTPSTPFFCGWGEEENSNTNAKALDMSQNNQSQIAYLNNDVESYVLRTQDSRTGEMIDTSSEVDALSPWCSHRTVGDGQNRTFPSGQNFVLDEVEMDDIYSRESLISIGREQEEFPYPSMLQMAPQMDKALDLSCYTEVNHACLLL